MSVTVIFSNHKDIDCEVMKTLWKGLDANVIEILPDSDDWEDKVDEAISTESDTLMIVGHGTTYGLLHPDFSSGQYIVHQNNAGLIKAKRVICCFCYASSFVQNTQLKAFATSMFISNVSEASAQHIDNISQDHIDAVGYKFYFELKDLIEKDIPMDQWTLILGAKADIEDLVDMFNRQGLYFT